MKIAAFITVAALSCGAALAQNHGSSTDRNTSATPRHSVSVANESPKGEGFVDKTKRAFHRLGNKLRGVGHSAKNKVDKEHQDRTAQQTDTRAMGAAGAGKDDSARRSRMDEGYAKSKKKDLEK